MTLPTVQTLFDEAGQRLELSLIAGKTGLQRPLADGVTAAADLVGHLNLVHPRRIQVLGQEELVYINALNTTRRSHFAHELALKEPPAVIMAESLAPSEDILRECEQRGIALFASTLSSAGIIDTLREYLTKKLAPAVTMHGVFMDVLGMGVLISGESGLGKSELALELISRGHGLVADDVVEFTRIAADRIEGRCPPLLSNLLEVRGLGLLDIKAIFGETAVRRKMNLKLIVHLVRRSTMEQQYERLPLESQTQDVLELAVRKVVIPVAAGRNLAVLLEAAVRNTVLQLRGIDTMKEFMERQQRAMNGDT
ncbi:MAG: HPr(Ser) kinase/phosphatase [Burkholderiaceae bacterium]